MTTAIFEPGPASWQAADLYADALYRSTTPYDRVQFEAFRHVVADRFEAAWRPVVAEYPDAQPIDCVPDIDALLHDCAKTVGIRLER